MLQRKENAKKTTERVHFAAKSFPILAVAKNTKTAFIARLNRTSAITPDAHILHPKRTISRLICEFTRVKDHLFAITPDAHFLQLKVESLRSICAFTRVKNHLFALTPDAHFLQLKVEL